jgi:hypothetical protein
MVCGMDWVNLWRDPMVYDVWIARGMNGDYFFEIPTDGSWKNAVSIEKSLGFSCPFLPSSNFT